jgi:Domain of unknown function (DUF397)
VASAFRIVEVAAAGTVLVRDATDLEGPPLEFDAGAWERFTASLR